MTRHGKYESELNEDFAAFAEHHGCAVMPARVRRPKDKALVEDAVKLVYKNIYTKLEGQTFYDLESLNQAIMVALEMHNNAPMTGGRPSRRSQYEEFERECMGKLNPIRFELKKRLLPAGEELLHCPVKVHRPQTDNHIRQQAHLCVLSDE